MYIYLHISIFFCIGRTGVVVNNLLIILVLKFFSSKKFPDIYTIKQNRYNMTPFTISGRILEEGDEIECRINGKYVPSAVVAYKDFGYRIGMYICHNDNTLAGDFIGHGLSYGRLYSWVIYEETKYQLEVLIVRKPHKYSSSPNATPKTENVLIERGFKIIPVNTNF